MPPSARPLPSLVIFRMVGWVPITGMTLPLVSYGGSSLVINCAALGLLVNVGVRRPVLLARRPFEYDGSRDEDRAVETKFTLAERSRNNKPY